MQAAFSLVHIVADYLFTVVSKSMAPLPPAELLRQRAPGLVLEFGRRALRKWVAINRSLQLASFVWVRGKGLAGFQGWVNLLQCYTFPDSVLLYVENVQLCF